MDRNMTKNEAEKRTNYHDPEIELQKCWDLKKVVTLPIIDNLVVWSFKNRQGLF